jgi:hypothetical protein
MTPFHHWLTLPKSRLGIRVLNYCANAGIRESVNSGLDYWTDL